MRTSEGKLAILAFLLLLAFVLFAPMRAGQEDRLVLEPEGLRMSVGDSYTLRCALSSLDEDQQLRFSTSDSRVARIDRDGTVHALSAGEAVIRAEASGGASAQTRVTVAGVPMTQLRLNVDEVHIEKGEYSGLTVSYNDDATDARIEWVSSDERVVRVDASGRIEGVGGGTAYVSAVSPSGMSASARVYVKVRGTAVHITPNQLTLGVGAHVPMKLSFLPLDSTDRARRWASSDPEVLSVDETGALNAHSPGTAYVTAVTADGLTAGMEVRVEPAPEDMQLEPSRATLERGDALQLQLMFLERDGSVEENVSHLVNWASSDPSVAGVDQSGLVTARKSGACRIDATADGRTVSCQLNVQVNVQEVTLNQSEVYLLREQTGEPIQLEYSYAPADPDDPTIVYTSNNELVATVTQDGLVEMTGGYGTAIITASAASGARAEFVVNVVTELPGDDSAEEEAPAAAAPEVTATPEVTPVPEVTAAPETTAAPGAAAAPPAPELTVDPAAMAVWGG